MFGQVGIVAHVTVLLDFVVLEKSLTLVQIANDLLVNLLDSGSGGLSTSRQGLGYQGNTQAALIIVVRLAIEAHKVKVDESAQR